MDASFPEGSAVVYCEGNFATTIGKTAHGLVRFTRRYRVVAVIDSTLAGEDAGAFLDGRPNGIPIVSSLEAAKERANVRQLRLTHFVIGLAPDGGRLSADGRQAVLEALRAGLNVDSGLHNFLSEDKELVDEAARRKAKIRDIRKPPPRNELHFFSGKIEQVDSLKIAVLGTDSAIGKRTTAWLLVQGLESRGRSAELIGTGQTAWLQGASYSLVLDSLVNDFVSGEIEHAVWSAWNERRPDALLIEGQGSLLNPAFPGGFEILAAGRPDAIVVQHAPARAEYDGFPGYRLHPLKKQLAVIELLADKPVIAITINHEKLSERELEESVASIGAETGLPVCVPLKGSLAPVLDVIERLIDERHDSAHHRR